MTTLSQESQNFVVLMQRNMLRLENYRLRKELEDAMEINAERNPVTVVAELLARIAELEAQLAAMRLAAKVGRRAAEEVWYDEKEEGFWYCCDATWEEYQEHKHAPDCEVVALLAQLEADNAGANLA